MSKSKDTDTVATGKAVPGAHIAGAPRNQETLRGRRILVTGGHGFIGRHLCRRLVQLGADVVAPSRQARSDFDGVRSVLLDLASKTDVDRVFSRERPEIVLHLASHVVGHRTPEVVMSTLQDNLLSTVHVLLAAHAQGCERVVLTGSLEEPEPDGTWPVPSSPYAAAKLAAGSYGRMFNALFDLPVVMLRVFMVYGPGQDDLKKLIPHVITSLARGDVPALSNGTRSVDWIYVDDVVEAFVSAALMPGLQGLTLDVGSGRLVTVREVVQQIFAIMGCSEQPRFGALAERKMEQIRVARVDASTAALDWRPQVPLQEGLRRSVAWYSAD